MTSLPRVEYHDIYDGLEKGDSRAQGTQIYQMTNVVERYSAIGKRHEAGLVYCHFATW